MQGHPDKWTAVQSSQTYRQWQTAGHMDKYTSSPTQGQLYIQPDRWTDAYPAAHSPPPCHTTIAPKREGFAPKASLQNPAISHPSPAPLMGRIRPLGSSIVCMSVCPCPVCVSIPMSVTHPGKCSSGPILGPDTQTGMWRDRHTDSMAGGPQGSDPAHGGGGGWNGTGEGCEIAGFQSVAFGAKSPFLGAFVLGGGGNKCLAGQASVYPDDPAPSHPLICVSGCTCNWPSVHLDIQQSVCPELQLSICPAGHAPIHGSSWTLTRPCVRLDVLLSVPPAGHAFVSRDDNHPSVRVSS